LFLTPRAKPQSPYYLSLPFSRFDAPIYAFVLNFDISNMQPSTHSIQTTVPVPVKPPVRQAVGKNNIKPTTAKSHAPHPSASASSAVNAAVQASVVATVVVPDANRIPAEHIESDLMSRSSSDECKQKVGTILREWDWN
jgi:hypothetical protein